MQQFLQPKLSW